MRYKIDKMEDIAIKFAELGRTTQKNLILITGLPGVGKTTLAKEFAMQTQGVHFDIDDFKREVVPKEIISEDIDPPEYRFKYYAKTIRMLPDLFAANLSKIVIIDETFHLKDFRELWGEVAQELGIRVHWVETICEEGCLKNRLDVGKNRENHILGKDKAFAMYLVFKEVFESMTGDYDVVDTTREIGPQVKHIIITRGIGRQNE